MTKFKIDDDYYLFKDEYSWNIGKKIVKKRGIEYKMLAYLGSPEQAINTYLNIKQGESAENHGDGTIYELLDIFITEKKRASETLQNLYAKVARMDVQNQDDQ